MTVTATTVYKVL